MEVVQRSRIDLGKLLTVMMLAGAMLVLAACQTSPPATGVEQVNPPASEEQVIEETTDGSANVESAPAVAPEVASAQPDSVTLRLPRYVQPAYTTLGTRNTDGNPGPNYWQNHAEHNISITVAPPSRTISATQQITYTNNSPNPMPAVMIRMYQNVRRIDGVQEEPVTEEFFNSGLEVSTATVNGTPIDLTAFDKMLPYKTVKLVLLPQPILPGGSANFTFEWQYELALEAKKEGVIDPTTFFLAYFFPRISVMSDADVGLAGLLPGADVEEFTYISGRELNNDFADFTFNVNVPKNYIVWATGDLQNPDEVLQPDYAARLQDSFTSDDVISIAQPEELQLGLVTAQTDTVTWHWKANNVPDIAIGLSDRYIWDAGSVVVDASTGRRASVQSAYAPEHTNFVSMVQDGKDALSFLSTHWPGVPYPFDKVTVFVGGADEEYPGMANDAAEASASFNGSTRVVAMHELAHAYFPFYMGIDERRYPYMDEGWTTAFEYLFNLEDIGEEAASEIYFKARSSFASPFPGEEIPLIAAADATRGGVTGSYAYGKSSLAYLALKEHMGDEAFKAALHEFITRWNGKRPLPWDMFNTFNDVSDENLNWFFSNWFYGSNYIDVAAGDVNEVDGGYEIQVSNPGGLAVPFDVKVVYTDGTEESFRQGPGVWKESVEQTAITIETDREVKSLTLDGGIFQDSSSDDNAWPATTP